MLLGAHSSRRVNNGNSAAGALKPETGIPGFIALSFIVLQSCCSFLQIEGQTTCLKIATVLFVRLFVFW